MCILHTHTCLWSSVHRRRAWFSMSLWSSTSIYIKNHGYHIGLPEEVVSVEHTGLRPSGSRALHRASAVGRGPLLTDSLDLAGRHTFTPLVGGVEQLPGKSTWICKKKIGKRMPKLYNTPFQIFGLIRSIL